MNIQTIPSLADDLGFDFGSIDWGSLLNTGVSAWQSHEASQNQTEAIKAQAAAQAAQARAQTAAIQAGMSTQSQGLTTSNSTTWILLGLVAAGAFMLLKGRK